MKVPYTYTVLRYVHDVTTGEFANVGVVVYSVEARYCGARFRRKYARLGQMFPGVKGAALKATLGQLQVAFERISGQLSNELQLSEWPSSIESLVARVLPPDDSSLQWSGVGSGLSANLSETLNMLWERVVVRYDEKQDDQRRTDEEIWRSFKKEFDAKKITEHLVSKIISSSDDEIEFTHAIKNGHWHCIEPVSLDLANSDSMKEKAIKWLGQMTSLKDGAQDDFEVYFLVGGPPQASENLGYQRALKILEKAEGAQVIQEKEAAAFSNRIAELLKHHR